MRLARAFSIVAGLALLSSAVGYVRDASLAANFGASSETDAYFAAFFVPNTLYLILLAGGISTAFVPIFVKYLQKDREEAWRVASTVFNLSFLLLALLVLAASMTIRYWIGLLFPGFDSPTMHLSADLGLIMLPMLLFIGLSSLVTAILNSFEHFTVPAIAPLLGNIVIIIFIIAANDLGGIRAVAIGVLVGMLVQFAIQLPVLVRYGARYRLVLDVRHPALRRLFRLALPLIAYLAVAYSALAIERNVASNLAAGTISAVSYAIRLFSLPLILIAGALGTVVYPRLSLKAADDDDEAFSDNFSRAMKVTTFFLLPISLWLIINSRSVVELLFGYGSFASEDIALTAVILSGYAIGMLANGLTRIMQRAFYALEDTSTPLRIEIVSLVVYLGLVLGLTRILGAAGLGSARGISFIIVALATAFLLGRNSQIRFDSKGTFLLLGRYLLASLVATAVWVSLLWISGKIGASQYSKPAEFVVFAAIGVAGFVAYFLSGSLLNLEETWFIRGKWTTLAARIAGQ